MPVAAPTSFVPNDPDSFKPVKLSDVPFEYVHTTALHTGDVIEFDYGFFDHLVGKVTSVLPWDNTLSIRLPSGEIMKINRNKQAYKFNHGGEFLRKSNEDNVVKRFIIPSAARRHGDGAAVR